MWLSPDCCMTLKTVLVWMTQRGKNVWDQPADRSKEVFSGCFLFNLTSADKFLQITANMQTHTELKGLIVLHKNAFSHVAVVMQILFWPPKDQLSFQNKCCCTDRLSLVFTGNILCQRNVPMKTAESVFRGFLWVAVSLIWERDGCVFVMFVHIFFSVKHQKLQIC